MLIFAVENQNMNNMAKKKCSINWNRPELWKADVQKSVLFYNDWFLNFAPATYINAR